MGSFQAKLLTKTGVLWQQEDSNQHGLLVRLLTEMGFYLENIEGIILSPNGNEIFRCHKVMKDPLHSKMILFKHPDSYLEKRLDEVGSD